MYWFRSGLNNVILFVLGFALLACLPACKPQVKNNGAFDLSGYFKTEAARLQKANRAVVKTVYHNGVTETKTVHIGNWEQELGLFIDADINKPTWKSNYDVLDEDSVVRYTAKDSSVKVREILITRNKQKIRWLLIFTKTPKNNLYTTIQKLVYYPDSLYYISTRQDVRFIGRNYYRVQGVISK
jgi:hypothetical protein